MSDYQAVGGVSATLQALLRDRMEMPLARFPSVTSVPVTVGTPPAPEGSIPPSPEAPRVNLFLYRVSENPFLKNQEIPGHGSRGAYGHPPLSLELHYLLTAYGTTTEEDLPSDAKLAHDLFGNAMRVLHDYPIVADQLVRQRVTAIGTPILDTSLLDEYEQVKLTLSPVGLDDLTKVWTALEQPFRVSAAYSVSVVQIESTRKRRYPRPVGEPVAAGPRIFAVPLRAPRIDEIRVKRFDDPSQAEHRYPYARIGDTLVILGAGFVADSVRVRIGGLDVPVMPASDTRVEVPVPDAAIGSAPIPPERRLQPGVVAASIAVGVNGVPQSAFSSNQAVFMLVPYVSAITPSLVTTPRTLQVQGKRIFADASSGETLIGRAAIDKRSYVSATDTQFTIDVPETLPSASVSCLVSGNLMPFPAVPAGAIDVQIGADGPRTVNFSGPLSIDDAALRLETAIRAAAGGGPGFTGARVAVVRDALSERLVLVGGGLVDDGAVTMSGTDPAATQLRLTSGQSTLMTSYLSGDLSPFPTLASAQPQFTLTIGAVTSQVVLAARPSSLDAAAALLQAGIRAASAAPAFTGALVVVLDSQLLVIPGNSQPMSAGPVAGVDATTVSDLQLSAAFVVRVRVNAAESIDIPVVTIP